MSTYTDATILTRWDDNGPLQSDYLTDCEVCGKERARSEMFWAGDALVCSEECEKQA